MPTGTKSPKKVSHDGVRTGCLKSLQKVHVMCGRTVLYD